MNNTQQLFDRLDWFQPFCCGDAETGQVVKTSAGCQIALVFFSAPVQNIVTILRFILNTMPCQNIGASLNGNA